MMLDLRDFDFDRLALELFCLYPCFRDIIIIGLNVNK